MSLFVLGPILYPDCFRLIYSVSRSVKKVFLFYTIYRTKSKTKAYIACKEAWKEIQVYFDNAVITHNIAVIKIWFDENEIFPSKDNDVESEFDLPVFKLWDSPQKLSGYSCSSFVFLRAYMRKCGMEFKPKLTERVIGKRKSKQSGASKKSASPEETNKFLHYRFPSYDASVRSDTESSASFSSLQKFLMSDYSIGVND
ncbi:uncharacterized protein LOC106663513 [Cimex lectularius]|uniref:Uncharacterized protein n=1 Tax=Cimex lectularius TaxID=79782 RepID=A0A8I6REP4_CIMLE|nr:uncharacterized protein LOC106663513 [Cimex lectularius]